MHTFHQQIDLLTIAQEFAKKYNKPLSDAIGEETSYDYKRLLQKLTIIKAETATELKPTEVFKKL